MPKSKLVPGIIGPQAGFETLLMDFGLAPDERLGVGVVSIDEGVDVLSELFDRGEGFVAQRRLCRHCQRPLTVTSHAGSDASRGSVRNPTQGNVDAGATFLKRRPRLPGPMGIRLPLSQ